ncbi:MAG: VIT1/CCC1 transporter family protein [Spirochaetes bacterium]|nr:VIT1/CCC1 transporter family protein [Spirochaetota bacterium]
MLTRKLDEARNAWKDRNMDASRAAHEAGQRADAVETHRNAQGKYLKSIVYGGMDGIVTTFAAVAGVSGANLGPGIVLIMGFANLIADGLSMSIGDFLSSKSEAEYEAAERERESWEVDNYPEGEKRELRELYVAKGMAGADAEGVVELVARNRKAWVDIMMVEELGIVPEDSSPLGSALATFFSFGAFGFLPLLAYVTALFVPALAGSQFPAAVTLTACTLFALGAFKTRLTGKNWIVSGLETLVVGGLAASAAYLVGALLGGLA